ncbi:MAG: hypothetical protein M1835_001118 [Candelina submexicana]|nr:MAG: hypothetical protein M1835_001118 [Candelina submexicana]
MGHTNRIWRSPCSRIQLEDLSEALVPGILLNEHSVPEFLEFVTGCVTDWLDSQVEIDLRWASFAPTFHCTFQQFVPTDTDVLDGVEMWFSYSRQRYKTVPVGSPPIACAHVDLPVFRLQLERYPDNVIEDHLYTFLEYYFGERNISYLFTSSRGIVSAAVYKLYVQRGQDALLKQALKLLVLIDILCRVIRVDAKSDRIIQPLIQYQEDPKKTTSDWFFRVTRLGYSTPTLANRQLKMVFASMVNPLLRKVLGGLQKAICRGREEDWTSAAAVLVILALITEQLEVQVHVSTVPKGTQPEVGAFSKRSAKAISQTINDTGFRMLLDLYTIRFRTFVASTLIGVHSNQSVHSSTSVFLESLRPSRNGLANPSIYPAELCSASCPSQYEAMKYPKPRMCEYNSGFEKVIDRVAFWSQSTVNPSSAYCADRRVLGYS